MQVLIGDRLATVISPPGCAPPEGRTQAPTASPRQSVPLESVAAYDGAVGIECIQTIQLEIFPRGRAGRKRILDGKAYQVVGQ